MRSEGGVDLAKEKGCEEGEEEEACESESSARAVEEKREIWLTASKLAHGHDRGGMHIKWNRRRRRRDEVLVVLERREDGVDDSAERDGGFDDGEE